MIRVPDTQLNIGDEIQYDGKTLRAREIITESGKAVRESGSRYYCKQDHAKIMVFDEVADEPSPVL